MAILVLLASGLIFQLCDGNCAHGIVWDNTGAVDVESSTTYVSIAGFDRVSFIPMKTTQKTSIYNPQNNTCMMSFIMYIDGEEVWAANDIQPGHGFTEIELNRMYEVGEYSGLMEIKCYDSESGRMMNSASFEFYVIVK